MESDRERVLKSAVEQLHFVYERFNRAYIEALVERRTKENEAKR